MQRSARKPCLLAVNSELRDIVAGKLILDWSPEQISGWLKSQYPHNESMRVAAHGYVLFEPNYRGTDSFGNKYMRPVMSDAADGPGRDIMAGIAALEKQGFIDESRIGVSGWSNGGYLTSWLTSHYHIWKTAISGAALNSGANQYNLSDYNIIERFQFGGSPWKKESARVYEEQSPITYASTVTTPTLILHDTGDQRVAIASSYAMYHALKDNGVTVKFIAIPVAGHVPCDPVRSSD